MAPWRDHVPERVFTEEFRHPPSDGCGPQRHNIARALELFRDAGLEVQDGIMRNVATGQPFTLDFIGVSYYSIRQNLSLVGNLAAGRHRNHRPRAGGFAVAVPQPHRQVRRQFGALGAGPYAGAATAQLARQRRRGPRLRPEFGRASAAPAVDSLIEAVIGARNVDELYAATRALDRVIMWSFYFIPLGSQPGFRLTHWDKFGEVRNDQLNRGALRRRLVVGRREGQARGGGACGIGIQAGRG